MIVPVSQFPESGFLPSVLLRLVCIASLISSASLVQAQVDHTVESMEALHDLGDTHGFNIVEMTSYWENRGVGGGIFEWLPSEPKDLHDGGTYIDPAQEFSADTRWSTQGPSTGVGIWKRQSVDDTFEAAWFGALGHPDYDSWGPIQNCVDSSAANGKTAFLSPGVYRIKKTLELVSNTVLEADPDATNRAQLRIKDGSLRTFLVRVPDNSDNVSVTGVRLRMTDGVISDLLRIGNGCSNITLDTLHVVGTTPDPDDDNRNGVRVVGRDCSEIRIENSRLSNVAYGFNSSAEIDGLYIEGCNFSGWTQMALRVGNNPNHAESEINKKIRIMDNVFSSPNESTNAGRHAIFVSRTFGNHIQDVRVGRNRVFGPAKAYTGLSDLSNATGDQIVLAGVDGFIVYENSSFDGGENGMTIGRLCRNGSIRDNIVERNDGNGIVIGSSFTVATVDNPQHFIDESNAPLPPPGVEDPCSAPQPKAVLEVNPQPGEATEAIVSRVDGNQVWLGRIKLGRFQNGDTLQDCQGNTAQIIDEVEFSDNIVVRRNRAVDNGIDREDRFDAYGFYVVTARNIRFDDNTTGNTTEDNYQSLGIGIFRSTDVFTPNSSSPTTFIGDLPLGEIFEKFNDGLIDVQ